MGKGVFDTVSGAVACRSERPHPSPASHGSHSSGVRHAAAIGDLHEVTRTIRLSGAHDRETVRQRSELLDVLADATLDRYRPRWDERLRPFLRSLNYRAAESAEAMLGDPWPGWEGGYRGCALDIARRSLANAVEADRVRLERGKRQRSGLTASWVAENISLGWSGAYLSQVGRHIEGQRPNALEQYAGAAHAHRLRTLAAQVEHVPDLFTRPMLNRMWRAYFKNGRSDLSADIADVLFSELEAAMRRYH
jgi:hypothetical protein